MGNCLSGLFHRRQGDQTGLIETSKTPVFDEATKHQDIAPAVICERGRFQEDAEVPLVGAQQGESEDSSSLLAVGEQQLLQASEAAALEQVAKHIVDRMLVTAKAKLQNKQKAPEESVVHARGDGIDCQTACQDIACQEVQALEQGDVPCFHGREHLAHAAEETLCQAPAAPCASDASTGDMSSAGSDPEQDALQVDAVPRSTASATASAHRWSIRSMRTVQSLDDVQLRPLLEVAAEEEDQKQLIEKAFSLADKDGSRDVSAMELRIAMCNDRELFRKLGFTRVEDVSEFIKQADVNGDGSLDVDEWSQAHASRRGSCASNA